MIEWHPATAKDIVRFYGMLPPFTIRAIVVTLNGVPEGLAGVMREGDINKFFSDHTDRLKPYLKTITVLRAIKAAQKLVMEYPSVVMAEAEHEEGAKLMERMGFTHIEKEYYAWLG